MRFERGLALLLILGSVVSFLYAALSPGCACAAPRPGTHPIRSNEIALYASIPMFLIGIGLGLASFLPRGRDPEQFVMSDGEAIAQPRSHAGLIVGVVALVIAMIGAFTFGPLIVVWLAETF